MFFSKRKDQTKKRKTEVERDSDDAKADLERRSTKLKRVREALNRISGDGGAHASAETAPTFALTLVRSKR